MNTILVTGAAGFIGSHTAETLLNKGYSVISVDNFDDNYDPLYKRENIAQLESHDAFVSYEADICNYEAVKEICSKESPDAVVHLAAKVNARNAVEDPFDFERVNERGTLNILDMAREQDFENVVLASSSSVYGNANEVPYKESDATDRPISPYGATKKGMEVMAHTYHHNFGVPITALRFFNVYGERVRPDLVMYIWIRNILQGKEVYLSGEGERAGVRERDFTYIDDIVRGIVKALETPREYEVINLGSADPISLNELLSVIQEVLDTEAKVTTRPSNKESVEKTYADITKARELLDWEPRVELEEGLTRLVSWFRDKRLKDLE